MQTIKKYNPPHLLEALLGFFLHPEEMFNLIGDYKELYNEIATRRNRISALVWYLAQIIITMPPFFFNSIKLGFAMIRNYLKITFRTLLKYKGFSIINITGLALSMSICLMIILFIKEEKSSDQFHEKKDRIYRIYTTDTNITYSEIKGWATAPGNLAPILKDNYPGIEKTARIKRTYSNVLKDGTAIGMSGWMTDPEFFDIFTYNLESGNQETALIEPYSIVLSKKSAEKFFGDEDPLGKTLLFETFGEFTVTGVLEPSELKSHFIFDALMSISTVRSLDSRGIFRENIDKWESFGDYYTYILLEDKSNEEALESRLGIIADSIFPDRERLGFKLQPLLSINLGINLINTMPGTKHSFEIIFIPFVAFFIIILACFNYIILSIARSLRRTKEIGMRKVIGARRNQIVKLFLSETFVITFFALVTACLIILMLVPAFNSMEVVQYGRQQINLDLLKNVDIYIYFLIFAGIVSIIAGTYPALYLSSFRPANALKGVSRIKSNSKMTLRKILMGIQFTVSILSIIIIAIIYRQHAFMQTYDKGVDLDNIVNVRLGKVNYETFTNELKTNSIITGVSASSFVPVFEAWSFRELRTPEMAEPIQGSFYSVNPDFIDNFGLNLIAGRNFSNDYSTDKEIAVIINEKAVYSLGLGSPSEALGKTVITIVEAFDRPTSREEKSLVVIGVLKDFNYRNLEKTIDPMVMVYRPTQFYYVNVKYLPGKKEEIKTELINTWKKFDEVHSVNYEFIEDKEAEMSSFFSGIITISSWGCGFIIIIALLGLLGMTSYSTEIRIKEIGIRKTLGATASNIVLVLSRDYIKLLVYSGAISIPLSWILTDLLLQVFAYRPPLNIWIFPGSLMFVIALAILTIGSQTIRAASENPVNTLRDE